jgi:hypothetical protein
LKVRRDAALQQLLDNRNAGPEFRQQLQDAFARAVKELNDAENQANQSEQDAESAKSSAHDSLIQQRQERASTQHLERITSTRRQIEAEKKRILAYRLKTALLYRTAQINWLKARAESETALSRAKTALASRLRELADCQGTLKMRYAALARRQRALEQRLLAEKSLYSALAQIREKLADCLRICENADASEAKGCAGGPGDTPTAAEEPGDNPKAVALDCLPSVEAIGPCDQQRGMMQRADPNGEHAGEDGGAEFAENFRFLAPAHFPLPGFGTRGEAANQTGALIYEGMRFSCHPNGKYQVEFVVRTPALPTTLHLRFLLREAEQSWQTVTLAPIHLKPEGVRPEDYKPGIYRVRQAGYSAALDRDQGPHTIRREGSARFGFGYEFLGRW